MKSMISKNPAAKKPGTGMETSMDSLETSILSGLYQTTPLAQDDVLCVLNNKNRREMEYDNCSLADGEARTVRCYYEDGAICMEQKYKNGKLEGESRIYYENGNLQMQAFFSADKTDGLVRIYYENGTMQSELNYISGKLDGDCRYFDESGILVRRESYKSGKRCD
jgi:antitoxin component YwqK of YwqJK toxin-antitoxin module